MATHMKTEETPFNRKKFILLCDFWDAYKTFELKQPTSAVSQKIQQLKWQNRSHHKALQ